ncbi:MAG TPA: TetR family transcriptional regulator [Pseudonocardiaceae bacterium]|jgi:AcrR family transcriptional regulator
MARWIPDAEGRLRQAALDLFTEHGYDNVTVAQIAEHAGLTRRSFFRYFPDKREVLFAGAEQLPVAIAEAIHAVPANVAPLAAVFDALTGIGTQLVELVDGIAERRAVIDASPELQERERTKAAAITIAIRDALGERDLPPRAATLLAQVASVAFQNAFERWVDGSGARSFADCLDEVTATIRDALSTQD